MKIIISELQLKKIKNLLLEEGEAVSIINNGRKLSGKCDKGNCKNGLGNATFSDGSKYSGNWVGGNRAYGKFFDISAAAILTGTWSGGLKNGNFTNVDKEGTKSFGKYVNNEEQGKWTFKDTDGRITVVTYNNGKQTYNSRFDGAKWKPCKKCIGTYGSGMVDCAYEAIERFEENYGTAAGTSMGDTYFEGNWKRFDNIILSRINGLVPSAWQSMSEKFKMQLWSFMYNSDSGGEDKFRWLAVLYLTANPEITSFDKKITSNIINKKDPVKWKEAVTLVSKTSSWNYNKFIKMLDGQYSTYGNEGAYKNTWSIRPTALTDMYDECKG